MNGIIQQDKGVVPEITLPGTYPIQSLSRALSPHQTPSFQDLWSRLWQRKASVLGFTLLGCTLALLLSSLQHPTYLATALIEVQGLNDNLLNTRDVDPSASSLNFAFEPYLQTQIKIIKSDSVIGRVVDELKLTAHPELLQSPSAIRRLILAFGFRSAEKKLKRQDFIDWAAAHLTVRLPADAHLIEIGFTARDPKLGADFTNAMVKEYIDSRLESHDMMGRQTSGWLNSQLDELKTKVQKSEQELQAYARKTGLLFTSEKDNIAEARLRQLQESLSKAHEVRVTQQAQYDLVKTASADSLPEVLDDEVLHSYQGRLTDLRRSLAELQAVLGPSHYKIQQLQAQIVEVQGAIDRKRANILSRIKNEYDAAAAQEAMLSANYAAQAELVASQSVQAVQYDMLKRELDTNRQLYETMLQKIREVGIASALRASNISIVDPAKPAERPFSPNRALYVSFGTALGGFLGLAFAFFPRREKWQVDASTELLREHGIPELGSIPLISRKHPGQLTATARTLWGEHAIAESFRDTMVSLLLRNQGTDKSKCPQLIVVSSCTRGEGRTSIATNLAMAFTESGRSVLLVDADFGKPRLHEIFQLDNSIGLSTILSDSKACSTYSVDQISLPTQIAKLHVLSSGPKLEDLPGLIHSGRMIELMRRLRSLFDIVIIDAPPVHSSAHARTLAKISDGVALVIRAGRTSPGEAIAAIQRFADDGSVVLGTIANGREKLSDDVPHEVPVVGRQSHALKRLPPFLPMKDMNASTAAQPRT